MSSFPKMVRVTLFIVKWKPHVSKRAIECFEDMLRERDLFSVRGRQGRVTTVYRWEVVNRD